MQSIKLRQMHAADINEVMRVETSVYEFPWTKGIFADCLRVGYECWVVIEDEKIIGHGVLSVAAGEAHILNICIDPAYRARGYGEKLLDELLFRARAAMVRQIFLEVRPSNDTALALYRKKGFHQVANRPAYYQASEGREDAAVLAKKLVTED